MAAPAPRNALRLSLFALAVLLLAAPAFAAHRSLEPGSVDSKPQWRTLSDDGGTLRLEFRLGALGVNEITADGETWQSLTIEGGTVQGALGAPAFPTVGRLVAVPPGATVTGRVIGFESEPLPSLRLYPIQPGREDVFTLDREAYAVEGWSRLSATADKLAAAPADPTAPVVLIGEAAIMAGQTVVPLTISPVVYDAVARRGLAARSIEIELTISGGAPKADARPVAASFDGWLRDNASGYDSAGKSAAAGALPGTYALVRHGDAAITSRTAALEAWRKRQGYHVEIVDVDVVGNGTLQIKGALQALYNDDTIPPLEFVTLVGDEDGSYGVPTWTETLSAYSGPGDHYYTTLDGPDVLSDVHIGRLSFETLDQLDIIVAKIIGYEQTPPMGDTSWFGRAYLQGDPSDSGVTTIFVNQWLKGHLEALGWAQVDTTWGGLFTTPFTSNVNDGLSVYGYRGYYNMSGITQSRIGTLDNEGMLPVAILPTCDTGTITQGECRSESWMRASNGGGIAAVGTATIGTHTRYNNCYYHGIWNGLLYNDDHRIGVAHTLGKVELYNNYEVQEPWTVEIWCVWNTLLGDPATDMWTGVPSALTVDHPASLSPGATAIPVGVTSYGSPVAGLVVCVHQDGVFQQSALTDAAGEVLLSVPGLTGGSVQVTVHGHGYLPYLGSLGVGTVGQFCGLEDLTISGDGVLNPGETVDLGVAVHNHGTSTAYGVTGTLTGGGPFGSVVSGMLSFGDIAPGATAWSAAPAQVAVAADAPHGELLHWPLAVTDGVGDWTSVVEVAVTAAGLSVDGFTWSGPGGDIDPGETGDLVIDLANAGGLNATAVGATLTTESPWITVNVDTAAFADVFMGGNGDNTGSPFGLYVNPECYEGHLAVLNLTVDYNGGMQALVEYVVTVGQSATDAPMGPDAYGYYAYDDTDVASGFAPTYDWVAIDPDNGGPGVDVGLGDYGWQQDETAIMDLPFTFTYYGQDYDRVSVCSNGWVAMGENNLKGYRNWAIPSAGSPAALIAPFWDNLYQTGTRRVYTWHDTTEHRFVVQWYDMPNTYTNAVQNVELILYDPAWHQTSTGDGMILFQYETVGNTDSRDGYATVGIQNPERTDGLMYSFWNRYADGAASLAPGRAILFMPLGEVLFPAAAVTPGTVEASAAPGNQAVEYLHVANDGEDGSQLNFTVTKVDPATLPATKDLPGGDPAIEPNSLEGSSVIFDTTEYEAGATVMVDMAVTCISPDQEWLVYASLMLPGTVRLVDASDMPTYHGNMAWNDATGWGAVATWGTGSPSGGFLDNTETGHVNLTLEFEAGLTGDVTFGWYIQGDNYGGPPHDIFSSLTLSPALPAIHVTAPTVGEVAVLGETIDLEFVSVNGPEFVTIELQRADAGAWETLATGVAADLGSWPWTVSGDPGPYARFRVTDEGDPGVFDESAVFAVGRNLDWLQLSAEAGSVPSGQNMDVTVTLDATDLADGVYEANLDVDHNGGSRVTVPVQFTVTDGTFVEDVLPTRVTLLGAHPNPFNPQTLISFALPADMDAELKVYSAEGRQVRTLLAGRQPAGTHRVLWDGRDGAGRRVASGVYLYRLVTGEGAVSGKVALLK